MGKHNFSLPLGSCSLPGHSALCELRTRRKPRDGGEVRLAPRGLGDPPGAGSGVAQRDGVKQEWEVGSCSRRAGPATPGQGPAGPVASPHHALDVFWVHQEEGREGNGTHSSTLAWKTPWTGEPGGLQSMGSRRVRQGRATSLSLFTFMHWRRQWQPTPGFLPGESRGRGSLVGCPLRGCTKSDTTEVT